MRAIRRLRVVALLDTLGNALILQLAFVVFSIPIITTVPAAVALQWQLADLHVGRRTGFVQFAKEFSTSWRASWQLGVLAPLVATGFAAAIPFWYSAPSPFARVGLGFLVCLLGLAGSFYLNVLRAAELARGERWRRWSAIASEQLVRHSLRSLRGLIVFFAWLVVLAYVPTLLLVGSGIVPALIVRRVLAPPADGQASRS